MLGKVDTLGAFADLNGRKGAGSQSLNKVRRINGRVFNFLVYKFDRQKYTYS
jgi:hypothetical protein